MLNLNFKKYLIFVIAFIVLWSLPLSSLALSSGGVGGYPAYPDPNDRLTESWFIYNLGPGDIKDDAIIIANTSDQEHSVKIYAVDSLPSNQGNFALRMEDEPKNGIGAWIDLEEDFITLQPGESRRVDFTITVPEAVDVGEHSGGIVIQKGKPGEVSGTGASIITRVGVRIYNTVPGEIIRKIRLEDFSVTRKTVENKEPFYDIILSAYNESNISLEPLSTLIIKGWGKTEYLKKIETESGIVVNIGELFNFNIEESLSRDWRLLRDSKVTTRWEWPVPEFGHYTFQVRVEYEGSDGQVESLYSPEIGVWVIPWTELAILAAILLLILVIIVLKKTTFGLRKWQAYKVKKGDDLFDLAEAANIKWEKLVKVNKLNAPKVRPGEVILLPPSFAMPPGQNVAATKAMKKTTSPTPAPKGQGKAVESVSKKVAKAPARAKVKPVVIVDSLPEEASPRFNKKYIWLGLIVVVIAIATIIFLFNKKTDETVSVPATTNMTQEQSGDQAEEQVELGINPNEVLVAIYEPLLPSSTAATTELLQQRLQELGFQTKITGSLVDANAAYQDKTTILARPESQEKLDVFAENALNTATYQQGLNEDVEEDLVISTWYVEEINWGVDLEPQAFELLNYDPAEVTIGVLNGGAPPGSAGKLATVLAEADYTQVDAANAENEATNPVTLYYQHTYRKTADKIRDVLRLNGFSGVHIKFKQEQENNVVILLGPDEETEE